MDSDSAVPPSPSRAGTTTAADSTPAQLPSPSLTGTTTLPDPSSTPVNCSSTLNAIAETTFAKRKMGGDTAPIISPQKPSKRAAIFKHRRNLAQINDTSGAQLLLHIPPPKQKIPEEDAKKKNVSMLGDDFYATHDSMKRFLRANNVSSCVMGGVEHRIAVIDFAYVALTKAKEEGGNGVGSEQVAEEVKAHTHFGWPLNPGWPSESRN